MQMKVLMVLIAVFAGCAAVIVLREFAPRSSVDSLQDLGGVYLNVLSVEKDAAAAGLSQARIREVVEERLNEAQIPLRVGPSAEDGRANLIVKADTIHSQGIFLFVVEVSLVQEVRLDRIMLSAPMPSETWSKLAHGLTTPNRMDVIYQPIVEKVDEFIAAYRAVNPL